MTTQWAAGTIYARDSLQSQASDLGHNWVQGLPLDADERLLQLLRGVTPAEVQSVAASYFCDDQLSVASLVPQPMAARPRKPAPDAAAPEGRLH